MVCKLTVKIQTKKYGQRNAKTRRNTGRNKDMQNRSAKKKRALNAARLVDMYLIIKDF
jgi:hypothetical protein